MITAGWLGEGRRNSGRGRNGSRPGARRVSGCRRDGGGGGGRQSGAHLGRRAGAPAGRGRAGPRGPGAAGAGQAAGNPGPTLDGEPVLLLVGDGPYRGDLERLAGRIGVSGSVVFTGPVPWGELPRSEEH